MSQPQSRQAVIEAAIPNGDIHSLRPLMTSLNGDNSWLFSFPRPAEEIQQRGKVFFHIVFEPWLAGPASGFMSVIALPETASCTGPEDIKQLISDIEHAYTKTLGLAEPKNYSIDCILLTLHIQDHLHEPTLKLFDKKTPVVATSAAAGVIKPWNHFDNVSLIHKITSGCKTWQSEELHPAGFPAWLTAVQMPGQTFLNFCSAIIWTHTDATGEQVHESILHSSHGTNDTGPLGAWLSAQPPTQPVAMMHPLKEGFVGSLFWKDVSGVKGGLELYRKASSKYWIVSHSAELNYTGLFLRLMQVYDVHRTLDWGLQQEGKEELERPLLLQVDNGKTVIL